MSEIASLVPCSVRSIKFCLVLIVCQRKMFNKTKILYEGQIGIFFYLNGGVAKTAGNGRVMDVGKIQYSAQYL